MAFNTTNLNRVGVFPTNGGYNVNENDNGETIEKEFNFSFLMFTQGNNASGSYYVNHGQSLNAVYSDAKSLFLTWVYSTYGNSPSYSDGAASFPLSGITFEQSPDSVDKWECSLTFKEHSYNAESSENETPTTAPVIGVTDVKYNLGANNTHITRSLNTNVLWTASGRTAVDYQNRINFNDGETAGFDIVTPQLNFQIVVNFSSLSANALSTIMAMVGTVNNATWGPFTSGTVLFRGGDIVAEKWNLNDLYNGVYWKTTFNFEYSPDSTITTPTGTTVNKGGWQYVWGKREKVMINGLTTEQIVQINAETVYSSSNFGNLGIVWES